MEPETAIEEYAEMLAAWVAAPSVPEQRAKRLTRLRENTDSSEDFTEFTKTVARQNVERGLHIPTGDAFLAMFDANASGGSTTFRRDLAFARTMQLLIEHGVEFESADITG